MEGNVVGSRYRIDSVLSRRGHRMRWLGTDTETDERVIIETLHDAVVSDPKAISAIRNEISLSQRLHSREFMTYVDSFIDEGHMYLIWKYVDAAPLTRNSSFASLTDQDVCRFITRIVKAIEYAHSQGIIHGSLSTDTILMTSTLSPIIIGFPLPGGDVATDPGTHGGISAYAAAAPELLQGQPIDETCDFYSIGVIAQYLFREVHKHHRSHMTEYQYALLQTRNVEISAARKVIENLASNDKNQRQISAHMISSPDFIDSLVTPAHGTEIVQLEKKSIRKAKHTYKQRMKTYGFFDEYRPFIVQVIAIIAVAVFIIFLLSQFLMPR